MSYCPFNFKDKRREWAQLLRNTRSFLDNKGYFEVLTPALVTAGAFESTIDPLKVSYSAGQGELHTSPEIEMKNILSDFQEPIYQICKCFRDDPQTSIHSIEFTMLEFYRPNSPVNLIEKEILELIQTLSAKPLKIEYKSVYNLVKDLIGLDLNLFTSTQSLANEIKKRTSLYLSEYDSWADIFFKLMIEIVEPSLSKETLILLNNYPAAVSPLSQPILGTNQAERFEIYWKGMEICNGCRELADLEELKRRYQHESQERIKSSKPPHPEPTDLFNSARNIKGASGVAIGLERLFLCLTQD